MVIVYFIEFKIGAFIFNIQAICHSFQLKVRPDGAYVNSYGGCLN